MPRYAAQCLSILTCFVTHLALGVNPTDDWFCKEVASQRTGNTFKSCGVGSGADENIARRTALENAKKEFGAICTASSDCRGHAISIQPERTSCEKEGTGYKCYRLMVFNVGGTVDSTSASPLAGVDGAREIGGKADELSPATPAPSPAAVAQALKFVQEPMDLDEHEAMKPFYYREISSLPKIKIGLPKAKVLQRFGKPDTVRESEGRVQIFYRLKPFCEGGRCSVRFSEKSGKVLSYEDFRYEYTEALK